MLTYLQGLTCCKYFLFALIFYDTFSNVMMELIQQDPNATLRISFQVARCFVTLGMWNLLTLLLKYNEEILVKETATYTVMSVL
jgi:hypothetical protein